MASVAQSIIGSSFHSAGGGGSLSPVGSFYWNGSPNNYYYAEGTPGSINTLSYNFSNETTASTTRFTGGGYQTTPTLGAVTNFWLDFWIYPTSLGVAILTEMDNNTSPGYYYNMMEIDNDGHIYAGTWNGGNISSIVSTDKVTVNAWNHIFFYFNSGTLGLEVNGGTAVTASGVTRSGPGASYIAIGFNSVTAMFTSNRYQGYIEPIYGATTSTSSRYNSTKSKYQAQQVFALYANTFTSNGTWTDTISSKAFTIYNNPVYSNTNGGQIRFNAANSEYGDTGAGNSLSPLSSYTIQGVFKVHTASQASAPCLITENWPGTGTKINYAIGYVNGSSQIDAGFFDSNAGYWNVLSAKTSPVANTWYDVVCTFYGPTKELRVYLDGVLVSNTTAPGTASSDNAGIRIARRWDAANYFDSTIKDINIWSGVLTPSEISSKHVPYSSLV
jgi:Concanavalin A-like lectin/glucanases superfamily